MKRFLLICHLLTIPCFAQTTSGTAATKGTCSPAVTGSKNTFIINCGIGKEQGEELLKIVNKILANQTNLKEFEGKLEEILRGVNDIRDANVSRLRSEVMKLLRFPEATTDLPPPPTSLEQLLVNKTPARMFDLLLRYNESEVQEVPGMGAALQQHLTRYHQFRQAELQVEDELLSRIGKTVHVRFRQGWQIYLTYALLRFGGRTKEAIIAGGSFLNYDITWEDAERVFLELSSDQVLSSRVYGLFKLYQRLGDDLARLVPGQPPPLNRPTTHY